MKIQLNSPRVKIAAASSFVLFGSVIGVILNSSDGADNRKSLHTEEVNYEKKPASLQELDELHSSWLFSSSESAVLVDSDSGFETATIGQ